MVHHHTADARHAPRSPSPPADRPARPSRRRRRPHTAGRRPSGAARAAWAARTLLGCGPRALLRTLRYLHATEAETPPGAWTLEFIGVEPAAAGRGAGGWLLDRLLAATPAPGGVFLTTADEANVRLYRRFGFTTLRRLTVGPLEVTAMWRPDPSERTRAGG